jgi:hypothetical protein
VEISVAFPIETLIEEVRFPSRLRSPWTVNVFFRFPTTTKKPTQTVFKRFWQNDKSIGSPATD